MLNKRKTTTAIVSTVAAAAILLGGTLAWTSIQQEATNETVIDINPGGRLHDDFDGENKDVYVENFGNTTTGVPIFARIRLDQYLEIGPDAGDKNDPADGEDREVDTIIGGDINDVTTWETYKPVDSEGKFVAVSANPLTANDNWEWNLGNGADNLPYYMPTFNKNKDSLKADINGTYEGKNTGDNNHYDDYVKYGSAADKVADPTIVDSLTQDAIYDWDEDTKEDYDTDTRDETSAIDSADVLKKEETHNATPISTTATVMSMTDYQALLNDDIEGNETGNFWVYDSDGWAYWAQPIEPEKTTGLLLDSINMNKTPDDNWYYGINVVGQFTTASDWEMFYSAADEEDGEEMTEEAKLLMEKITGQKRKETIYALLTENTATATLNTDGTKTYTLNFVSLTKDEPVPVASETYNNETIIDVYENVGTQSYGQVLNDDGEHIGTTAPWSDYTDTITTVNIAETIQPKYTNYWFFLMENLTTVNGSKNLDTSKLLEMGWMFDGCENLENLDVSSWDTSNVINMFRTFTNCAKLPVLDVGNWDTSKVNAMNGLFASCATLEDLAVDDWDVSNVNSMHLMFSGCSNLTELDLGGWDVGNLVYPAAMFFNCANLKSVGDLSAWNLSSAQSMDYMFNACPILESVGNLNTWNVSNVTNMNAMFANCHALTSVGNLNNWDVSKVTTMQDMFNGCTNLTNIGDISGWNVGNVTSMANMFNGCTNLTNIGDLSNWNVSNVTTMERMFESCEKLESVGTLNNWNVSNAKSIGGMFHACRSLETVGNLDNWDVSNATNIGGMFAECENLKTVGNLDNWEVGNVTTMASMFSTCTNLESVGNLANWEVGNVTTMHCMFLNCKNLKSVGDISGWDVSQVNNMNGTFMNCSSLTDTLDLSGWDVANVGDHGNFNTGADKVIAPTVWTASE